MTDDPNRLVEFTMDGVAYKGRPVCVQEIRRLLNECEVTGRAEPPDVQKLHDTIEGQSDKIDALQGELEIRDAKIVELRAGGDSGAGTDSPPANETAPPKVTSPKPTKPKPTQKGKKK